MNRAAEKKRLMALLKSKPPCTNWSPEIAMEEMTDYLLENGVIVPKFKAGDKVIVIDGDSYFEGEVKGLMDASLIYAYKKYAYLIRPEGEYLMYADEKDIFFSKAEAEYALKNRRSVSLVNGHIEE